VLVGVLLAAFATAGLFEVVSGGTQTSGSAVTGAGATPTTLGQRGPTTLAVPLAAQACSAPGLAAGRLLRELRQHGFPVAAVGTGTSPTTTTTTVPGLTPAGPISPIEASTTTSAPPPGAACTSVAFTDTRGRATSEIAVFRNPSDAQRSVGSPGVRAIADVVGPAVLKLDPSLAPFRSAYVTAVRQLLAKA